MHLVEEPGVWPAVAPPSTGRDASEADNRYRDGEAATLVFPLGGTKSVCPLDGTEHGTDERPKNTGTETEPV